MDDMQGRRAVVGAALVDDLATPTLLLAARRTEPPALAGRWEFPGGKVDPGETLPEALHRELMEELGVEIRMGPPVAGPLQGGGWLLGDDFVMFVWLAEVASGRVRALEDHDEIRWLDVEQLFEVDWLPADLPIVEEIARRMSGQGPPG